jgi:hypothetical protein
MVLVALAGAAPLGVASLMEGCGSGPASGVGATQVDGGTHADGASPEASPGSGGSGAGIDSGSGGPIEPDGSAPPANCWVCPDAGYFITITGDGVAQTLGSNSMPGTATVGIPSVPWAQASYYQGLTMGASTDPDGGASLWFDVEIHEDQNGGLTINTPTYSYAYYTRQDGTSFSPGPGLSASMTLTEVGPPGGVIAGSYTVAVVDKTQPDAGDLALSGTFLVCRLCDFIGPTPAH